MPLLAIWERIFHGTARSGGGHADYIRLVIEKMSCGRHSVVESMRLKRIQVALFLPIPFSSPPVVPSCSSTFTSSPLSLVESFSGKRDNALGLEHNRYSDCAGRTGDIC
jgi:hypothetical protein